jgi:Ca2+-binding RTX toxin-like protein
MLAAWAAALIFSVSGAVAATPLTDYTTNLTRVESPNPQANGQWSQRMRTVPDLNGDATNEILVADYRESFGGFAVAGRVYMQDGATRRFLYFIDSPQIQANSQFGFVPAVIGDVSGDGKADFVAGADAQDTLADGTPCTPPPTGPLGTCNQDQGKAWVFSGANGRTLYELNTPSPQGFARFGIWTGRAGDINNDGVQDVIVGASTGDVPAGCGNGPDGRRLAAASVPVGCRADEGEAFIFSGRASDHAGGAPGLLRTLNLPATDRAPAPCGGVGATVGCGNFGLPVQGVGDLTGDGVIDHQIGATNWSFDTATNGPCADPTAPTCSRGQGAVYLFSGATGALIRRTDDPVPAAGAQWGLQDGEPLAPGDVNEDGTPDYSSSAALQSGPTGLPGGGRSWVFSGATGAVLYEVKDPTPTVGGAFGFSLARTDYNKDGTPDLYVGQNPHHPAAGATGKEEAGGTFVFNGKDGTLLKSLELPPSDAQTGEPNNLGSNLGWSIVAPGDLNGDGEPDYVAGAPFEDVDPDGVLPFNCQASTPGCVINVGRQYLFLSNVPPAPGSQAPVPQQPQPQPAATFAGCSALTENVIRGTAAGDTITGTTAGDRIFAGTGNDVVDGVAGNDCIDFGTGDDRGQGGLGEDLLLAGTGNDRVSGSSGNDDVRGNAGNDRLDGGRDDDRVFGDAGNDTLLGGFGNDRLHGVGGRDAISGSSGRDRINGGPGSDRISGGSSADQIAGDAGNDRIDGNSGTDRISGNSGNDRITSRDNSRDRVNCGSGRDSVLADRKDIVSRNCEQVRRG